MGAYLALLAPLHNLLIITRPDIILGWGQWAVEWAWLDVGCLALAVVVRSSFYPIKRRNTVNLLIRTRNEQKKAYLKGPNNIYHCLSPHYV